MSGRVGAHFDPHDEESEERDMIEREARK